METVSPSMFVTLQKHRTIDGRDAGGESMMNHVYLNGVRVAAVAPSGSASYYLSDQVDSVKVVTNDSGLVVTSHEYLPFGEDWITEGDTKNAPKYNSQELDKETGYYFYNARHYDPEIGRFVTADSVVDGELSTQGWNKYAYCKNNPIIYKDPTGHNVVVLEAPEGAGGLGHTAALVESKNEETGKTEWLYYSRQQKDKNDGTFKGSPNAKGRVFKNPDEFFTYQTKMAKERTYLENKKGSWKNYRKRI
jgi:RHS repeat-associated protein